MFSMRSRRDAGIATLEIVGVLVVLSIAVALSTRYALFDFRANDYSAVAQYIADREEITRQGAGAISQAEVRVSFAPTISVSASTPQGVVARFEVDDESYAIYSRARMLTPALLDKINLYGEAVR